MLLRAGTTILIWGSFQEHQTNIWAPQSYKDPRLQEEFQTWCTATASLVDAHRILQLTPAYVAYREVVQPTTQTLPAKSLSLEEQILLMPPAQRLEFLNRLSKKSTPVDETVITSTPTITQPVATEATDEAYEKEEGTPN